MRQIAKRCGKLSNSREKFRKVAKTLEKFGKVVESCEKLRKGMNNSETLPGLVMYVMLTAFCKPRISEVICRVQSPKAWALYSTSSLRRAAKKPTPKRHLLKT